jgi:hypothetical protein
MLFAPIFFSIYKQPVRQAINYKGLMPFDPNLPATNTPLSSAQMRAQLTGLKAIADQVRAERASHINDVAELNIMASDPPTVSEMQQVIDKLNEVITALKRA